MTKRQQNSHLSGVFAIIIALFALSNTSYAQSRYGYSPQHSNHLHTNTIGANAYAYPYTSAHRVPFPQHQAPLTAYNPYPQSQNAPYTTRSRYGADKIAGPQKRGGFGSWLTGGKPLHLQRRALAPGPGNMFQKWVDYEPLYKFYPGDQLDIVVSSAPEMSRTLTVGPDGRIAMPMVTPIMAAGRTLPEVQIALRAALATQLRDPSIAVTPRAFAPEQIYVGGDVRTPGTYTLPGPIGALEAMIMAGGKNTTSNAKQVAVLRRALNGGMMMRTVNLTNGLKNIREYDDNIQLRRGDIIFVPRSTLGEIGVFVQNLRSAMPIDFNASYQFGNNFSTGVTP